MKLVEFRAHDNRGLTVFISVSQSQTLINYGNQSVSKAKTNNFFQS